MSKLVYQEKITRSNDYINFYQLNGRRTPEDELKERRYYEKAPKRQLTVKPEGVTVG